MRRALARSLCAVVLCGGLSVVPELARPATVVAAEPDSGGEVPVVPLPDPAEDVDPAHQIDTLPAELGELPADEISEVPVESTWTDVPGMPVDVRVTAASPLDPPAEDPADPDVTPEEPTESPTGAPSGSPSADPTQDPAPDPDPTDLSVSLTSPDDLATGVMLLEIETDEDAGTESEDPAGPTGSESADPAVFLLNTEPDPTDPGAAQPVENTTEASGVAVRLDYGGFDDAFGGYWADRLVVKAYPACFAETPEDPDCSTGVPVTAVNNTVEETLRFTTISTADLEILLDEAEGEAGSGATGDGDSADQGADGSEEPSDGPTDSLSDDPTPPTEPSYARRSNLRGRVTVAAATVAAATVDSGVTYAVSSAPGGYGPTPVAPAGEWQVGVGSGEFSYSYPFRMPPATGGAAPSLSLSYSSGSVDGMTSAENGQGSAAGMGWSIDPGFVSRSYTSCSDDGHSGKGDLCWKTTGYGLYEELTMSLNGHSAKLIPIDGGDHPNQFRLKDDPGWRIVRITDANPASEGNPSNDDDNDEAFKVTTPDGTVYWFGHGNGTDSVFTVPVYGNDSGEPCYDGSKAAADRWCQQGWRWNLDKVIDPSGNVIRYFYSSEQNYYARWANVYNQTIYDKGGLLARIEYGFDRAYAGAYDRPRQIVYLDKKRRCTPQMTDPTADCTGSNDPSHAPGKWPDVPSDLICGATGACTVGSPSFFSTWRYYRVRTVLSGPDGQIPVDTWDFDHDMPDPDGDGDDQPDLWLDQIQHTGNSGGSITEAGVNFNGIALQNRVAPGAGRKYLKFRVDTVRNQYGGRVEVDYGHAVTDGIDRKCTPDYVDGRDRWASDKECFAAKWTPPSANKSSWEWFHKYVVKRIALADDTMGLSSRSVNSYQQGDPGVSLGRLRVYDYDYTYAPAWRYTGSPQVPQGDEPWSDWRGYEVTWVQTRKTSKYGEILPGNVTQQRVTRYRGMNLQPTTMTQANNGTGPDNVRLHTIRYSDTTNQPLDKPELDGLTAETVTENSAGERLRLDYHGFGSVITADSGSRGRAKIRYPVEDYTSITEGGGNKIHTVTYRVADADPHGILAGVVTKVIDSGGSWGLATDDTCTTTVYDTDTTRWFRAPKDVKGWGAGFCPQDPENPGNANARIVSHSTTVYDDKSRPITSKVETSPGVWSTSTTSYDQYGRVDQTVVPGGGLNTSGGPRTLVTAIDYNPGAADDDGKLLTSVRSTVQAAVDGGADLVTTTDVDPARGAPVKVVDPNGDTTTVTYDALGRTKEVRYPVRGTTSLPSVKYEYTTSVTDPSRVHVLTLQKTAGGAEWADSYSFYDGWGRLVESQQPQPDGDGRIVSVTGYNELGQVRYAVPAAVNGQDPDFSNPLNPDPDTVRRYTITDHDALGRPTTVHRRSYAADLSATTTSYTSSVITVNPPGAAGNVETTTDALGRTTRVVERTSTGAVGDQVDYTYNEAGQLATATKTLGKTDPTTGTLVNGAHVWDYGYDMAGRQLWAYDPDTGSTVTSYDHAGNPVTVTTGPIGRDTLDTTTDPYRPAITEPVSSQTTTYDRLSRPVKVEDTTASSPVELTRWSYDQGGKAAHALGRLTAVTQQIPHTEFNEAAVGADEFTTGYTYDNRGQVTDTTYTYPAWITGQTATDSAAGTVQLASHTTYNQADEPIATTYPALPGLAALTVNASYVRGWLRSLTTSTGSTQLAGYSYNLQGQVTVLESGDIGASVTSGLKRTYDWDETTGRLASITGIDTAAPQSSTTPLRLDYLYDDNDNPTQTKVTTSGGSGGAAITAAWCYTYDALNRIDSASVGAANAEGCDVTVNDSDSNLVAELGGRSAGYELDYKYNKDRLTNVNMTGVRSTAFDNKGAEGPHQTRSITTGNGASGWPDAVPLPSALDYDHQGRITSWTPASGFSAPAARYTYNHQGQLATTTHGYGTPGAQVGAYAYHADGTRMIRRVKTGDNQTETVLYLPDGSEISLTTTSQSGNGPAQTRTSTRHFATPNGTPLATQLGTDDNVATDQDFTWLMADAQNSVRLVLPETGAVSTYHYYPFGDPVTNAPPSSRGYLDRPHDPTGDIRLDHRNYTPGLNQLTTPDPILDPADPQSYNPYAYSRNNPITLEDPSGLMAACLEHACQSSGAAHPETAPGCVDWWCFDMVDVETWYQAGLLDGDPSADAYHAAYEASGHQLPSVHTVLDVVSATSIPFISDGADIANGSIYAAEGEWAMASLYAVGVLSPVGAGALKLGVKSARHADELIQGVDEATHAAKSGTEIRKVGSVLETVDDVMANPALLKGRHPALVENILKGTPGWQVEKLGRGSQAGRGWVFRQYTPAGNPTGQQLRWHPGGGHHGPDPYWRVVGPNGDLGGIIR